MTTGYVNAATFNAQVALLASNGLTWTEGGIQVGAANNTPGATANPDMMFVVTDGSPFVSQADKNPTWTILALSMRTSEYISAQRKAGAL